MAQFRTTADLLDLALQKAGEVTNGNSPYETEAKNYINRVHQALVAGGTIPISKEQSITINEVFPWARERRPLILELQPKFDTGSVTLTQGSEDGTFTSAPTFSVAGWRLKLQESEEWVKIARHTSGGTTFELDAAWPDETRTTANFKAVKLDYDLIPDFIIIDERNTKIDFEETASTELTATLTEGTYTPADLATEVKTQLDAAGASTYTVTYDTKQREFTLASNRTGGGNIFKLLGATGTNAVCSALPTLGFDDLDLADAASHKSVYVLGGISRLIQPMNKHRGHDRRGQVFGIDPESFQRDYPFNRIREGNPTKFAVTREEPDGTFTVRFDRYPKEKMRLEVDHVAVPRDLQDNAASIPLVPRKHVEVLVDATTFFIMLDKSDNRAGTYAELVSSMLHSMIAQNRSQQLRSGEHFGATIPRREQIDFPDRRHRLRFGYTSDC